MQFSSTHALLDIAYVICYNCSEQIKLCCETVASFNQSTSTIPVLPIGQLIRVINQQHVWHNDIGIIRDKKFKHYRIEVHGQLVWMPEDWVEACEE